MNCQNHVINKKTRLILIDFVIFALLMNLKRTEKINPFKPSDAFHIKTSHLIYSSL